MAYSLKKRSFRVKSDVGEDFIKRYVKFLDKHNFEIDHLDGPISQFWITFVQKVGTYFDTTLDDIILCWTNFRISFKISKWYQEDIQCKVVNDDIELDIESYDSDLFKDDAMKREFVYLIDSFLKKNQLVSSTGDD